MFDRIICTIVGHNYVVERIFSATSRKLCCARCGAKFGMNDNVRAVIPWSGDLEEMYRITGQWPGHAPNRLSTDTKEAE